jgi:acylphosphatase
LERRSVHYSGRVQGVGFRYSTHTIAKFFAVTGFVQNLQDGRVRLVVEGFAADLDAFLQRIQSELGEYIHCVDVDRTAATGEFAGFEIK